MSEIILYHNPQCSKSRQTLELLLERGTNPRVIHYLDTPPDIKTLSRLLQLLEGDPNSFIRKKEHRYEELGIEKMNPDRAQLLQLMVENPILIERPIAVKGDVAVIGRPPENVLALLDR